MDDQLVKVLLIEDNPIDARLIRVLLTDTPGVRFEVEGADRLSIAIESLSQRDKAVDVIILDLSLPDSQGIATFQAIDTLGTAIPIVVLTGLDDSQLSVQAMRQGAQDYLVKGQVDSHLLARSLQYSIERKRLESALRGSEERYRDLFENAHDMIQSVTPEGRFVYVNRAWRTTLGFSEDEIAGLSIFDIIHPNCRDYCQQMFGRVLDGEELHNVETVFVARDGRCIDVEGNANCRFDKGKPLTTRAIFRDVTKRKQAEQRIRQLNADLERRVEERTMQLAASNRELEAFSYSVCHDLRAPLRRIDGFSSAVLDNYGEMLDEQGKHFLHRMRTGVQHMGLLIDAMLNLSRMTAIELRKESVDLSELARAILADCLARDSGREVEVKIAEGLVVEGDPELLQSAMENLLWNAWKFTEHKPHTRIEFGATQADGETPFFVRDNGAGFNMTFVDELFGPFQRLHGQEEFEGIGIGLATVQRIIHRHRGRVWAEGAVDEGATFYFTLP
ncbi:MAG: PAS domain S-box protein [Planctomycetaceae bacterium]|jgi:PAS domain S-box-containing protein|nr:PAS domain S-box protein [Planctomycetaceae bacterium]MBT6153975.1 PAS domain S-box protein [Planctomycetaceae bacterium]MBT6495968.1 PAS domain S-box protein [Planctomycetaceae bacterium]